MHIVKWVIIWIATAWWVCGSCVTQGAEIVVIAVGSIEPALEELIPEFECQTGHKVAATYSAGGAARLKIINGDSFDVAVMQASFSDVIASGRVVINNQLVFATVAIGVAVRKGAAKPDISTANAVKRMLLEARAISYPNPAAGADAGRSVSDTLEKLGIAEEVRSRTTLGELNARTVSLVANGDVEIGLTYISEVKDPLVEVVGPLPRDISTPTPLTALLSSDTRNLAVAKEFIDYVSSTAATAVYRRHGIEPVQ